MQEKYSIKIENFEGPLDLLVHLIDKHKMDICNIQISQIAEQYIDYLEKMEKMNLDITSEFLIMASNLIYLKSKSILPVEVEDKELTEEELIQKIIEYKSYKQVCGVLKENYDAFSTRFFKPMEYIELPKQKLYKTYKSDILLKAYNELINKNNQKVNQNAKNMEKIAVIETCTVASKVKQIFKELIKHPKIIFSNLFANNQCSKVEIVTAFTSVLELTRRQKVIAVQEEIFGDIIIEKTKRS